ncbi:MAG: hypothetical protein WKF75_15610, partial [Singulisphaera sp.]
FSIGTTVASYTQVRSGSVRTVGDCHPSIRLHREQTLATASNDIDSIRQQMAQIRHELHQDVRSVVENAEAATDWRRYFRMYPWPILAVTFVVGYLIVPQRRRKSAGDLVTRADIAQVREAVKEIQEPAKKSPSKGVLGAVFGMLVPVVTRAAQGYAMQYFETWLAQQQNLLAGMGASPPPTPGGPGRPSSPGQPQDLGRPPTPGSQPRRPPGL